MADAEGATAPGISQAKGPRAPDSLESVHRSLARRWATEGVTRQNYGGESSQVSATDGGDDQSARWRVGYRHMSRERPMSREVHDGPTDQRQARGEPYSGDPEGGAGVEVQQIQTLALDSWHRAKGARMVPFAGYEMPVQFEGIIAEHLWTREKAGLFDVSHMGQLLVHGADADAALETLLPGDLRSLADMKLKYSLLLDD